MTAEQQADQDTKWIETMAEQIGERFDAVQIIATRHEPATACGTISFEAGTGNFHARLGVVRDWLVRQDEEARVRARARQEDDE